MKIFKRVSLILSITLCCLVFSCSNDDDSQLQITENQLLGKWNLVEFNSFRQTETIIDEDVFFISIRDNASDFDFKLIFSEQPNKLISQGTYRSNRISNFDGNILESGGTFNASDPNSLFKGDWEINNNKLNLIQDGFVTTLNIIDYSENFIKLSIDDRPSEETNTNNPELRGTTRTVISENSIVLVR